MISEAKNILQDIFGHEEFRLAQEQVIEANLNGHDVLSIMPTGGGKSLCYQIPALLGDGLTLVISPLISLMNDQIRNLKESGIQARTLNSTLSQEDYNKVQHEIETKKLKLLYISPEGLFGGRVQNLLRNADIQLCAIDEAHCLSQWGHEFRNDYMKLSELKNLFPKTQVMALTATADSKTQKDIIKQLGLSDVKTFVSSFDRPNIRYMIRERRDEVSQLNDFIQTDHKNDTGIVYCLSRKKVERIAGALKDKGHNALAYHAGLAPEERLRVQRKFEREETVIIVATIAFGMGIDRPDVRFVAHLDLPKSVEGYYQETGRAGRDGKASSAWMVYGLQDVVKLSQMLETTQAPEFYKKVARLKLDQMLGLCETPKCRRQYLLNYFDEQTAKTCGNCDVCLDPPKLLDFTEDAQKVLSAIFKTKQMFGSNHVVDVLRGSKAQKTLDKGHDKLSVFGIGKQKDKGHWNGVIRQLLNQSYIKIRDWEYKNLALTDKAKELLKGETPFLMRTQSEKNIKQKPKKKAETAQHEHMELFETLKALRKDLADEKNVPPYVIFSDKTLHEICTFLPRHKDDFLMIHGVGQKKLDEYGVVFLAHVKAYIKQQAPLEDQSQNMSNLQSHQDRSDHHALSQ